MNETHTTAIKIRVLIADDHTTTRIGIRSILKHAPDIEVVGEASDGNEVKTLVAELRPDVLLLDLIMPGLKPSEIELWVHEYYPHTETLILTGHLRDAHLSQAISTGVSGVLTKNESPERLIEAIRRTFLGQTMFTKDQLLRASRWRAAVGDKWDTLSKRERQVLEWMVQGLDNRTIASFLNISLNTVRSHNRCIFRKLGVNSRSEAVAFVLRHQVLDL
ncbi:MAG: LuxR C-terminal-related transcriptional regulator [Chloroflexota bacterium]